jgi:SprT protein
VSEFLIEKVVHFTVTKDRKSKYGDYRQPYQGKPHLISVNGTLNKYAFLITTLHEMAHLTAYEKYRNSIPPHGPEWKAEFQEVFKPVMEMNVLPMDVTLAVKNYLKNLKASSCSDDALYRVLKRYDKNPGTLVEHLQLGEKFKLNGVIFVKGKKLRKRYECRVHNSRKVYRVLGVAEVEKLKHDEEE